MIKLFQKGSIYNILCEVYTLKKNLYGIILLEYTQRRNNAKVE